MICSKHFRVDKFRISYIFDEIFLIQVLQLVDLDQLAGMTSFIGFINFRVGCRPSCQDV